MSQRAESASTPSAAASAAASAEANNQAAMTRDALHQEEMAKEKRRLRNPDEEDDDRLDQPNIRAPTSSMEDQKEREKAMLAAGLLEDPSSPPMALLDNEQHFLHEGKKSVVAVTGIGAIAVTGGSPEQNDSPLPKKGSPDHGPSYIPPGEEGAMMEDVLSHLEASTQPSPQNAQGAQQTQSPSPGRPAQPGAIPVAGIGGDSSVGTSEIDEETLADTLAENIAEPSPAVRIESGEVVAQAVTRDDLEEEIQRRIIAEATIGEVVHPEEMEKGKKSAQQVRKERCTIALIVAIGTACFVTFLAVFLSVKDKDQAMNQEALQSFLAAASMEAFGTEDPERLKLAIPDSPQEQAFEWLAKNLEAFPVNNATQEQQLLETYALATLYYSTGGNETWDTSNPELGLESWMVGTDACVWLPDPADCKDGLVERLTLAGVNLTSTLPEELVFLTELEELNLAENRLTGSLPTSLPSALALLSLDSNQFEGEIPMEMTQLKNLTQFTLTQNAQLTATLPQDLLASWTNLQILRLDETPIQGTLPSTVGMMTSLLELSAERVGLSGQLPTEIGLCQRLQTFRIPQFSDLTTNISGTLPEEIWTITVYKQLTQLMLDYPSQSLESAWNPLGPLSGPSTLVPLVYKEVCQQRLDT